MTNKNPSHRICLGPAKHCSVSHGQGKVRGGKVVGLKHPEVKDSGLREKVVESKFAKEKASESLGLTQPQSEKVQLYSPEDANRRLVIWLTFAIVGVASVLSIGACVILSITNSSTDSLIELSTGIFALISTALATFGAGYLFGKQASPVAAEKS